MPVDKDVYDAWRWDRGGEGAGCFRENSYAVSGDMVWTARIDDEQCVNVIVAWGLEHQEVSIRWSLPGDVERT